MNKITMLDEQEQKSVEEISMQEISGIGISQTEETSEEELLGLMNALKQKTQSMTSEEELLLREKERLEKEKEERDRKRKEEEANRLRYEEEQRMIREREEEERRLEQERLEAERLKREASLSYKIRQGLASRSAVDLSPIGKLFFITKRIIIAVIVFAIYNATSIATASFIIGRLSK